MPCHQAGLAATLKAIQQTMYFSWSQFRTKKHTGPSSSAYHGYLSNCKHITVQQETRIFLQCCTNWNAISYLTYSAVENLQCTCVLLSSMLCIHTHTAMVKVKFCAIPCILGACVDSSWNIQILFELCLGKVWIIIVPEMPLANSALNKPKMNK